MPLWPVLLLGGLICFGIGRLALDQLMPRLKTRERRGLSARPVPDPEDSQWAAARLLWHIWTVKASTEGPRYRRHVMTVRWLPLLGIGLIVASAFVMQAGARHAPLDESARPPSLSLAIGGQAEPVVP